MAAFKYTFTAVSIKVNEFTGSGIGGLSNGREWRFFAEHDVLAVNQISLDMACVNQIGQYALQLVHGDLSTAKVKRFEYFAKFNDVRLVTSTIDFVAEKAHYPHTQYTHNTIQYIKKLIVINHSKIR